jgi:hypothetical protein
LKIDEDLHCADVIKRFSSLQFEFRQIS